MSSEETATSFLRSIRIQNLGPIRNFELDLPFEGDRPLPVCLVGTNGSGKSTVMSTVVNALVYAKDLTYQDTEMKEKNDFYRTQSGNYISDGADFTYTHLKFDHFDASSIVLTKSWSEFRQKHMELPFLSDTRLIHELHHSDQMKFTLSPKRGLDLDLRELRKCFDQNCVLYFPPNRFEHPSWLNEQEDHSPSLDQATRFKHYSYRSVISDSRLNKLVDWIFGFVFDDLYFTRVFGSDDHEQTEQGRYSSRSLKLIHSIIQYVLELDEHATVQLYFGSSRNRKITIIVESETEEAIYRDLNSLSSGQISLFVLFCSIICDFDSQNSWKQTNQIKGIVLVDEFDKHLSIGLQRNVVPKLMALFPHVQFIFTTHSPLLVLGIEDEFGKDKTVVELPSCRQIQSESFCEFERAYDALEMTTKFQSEIKEKIRESSRPLLLTEGKTDAKCLRIAWNKLYEESEMPFEILAVGIEPDEETRSGGAEQLRRTLEFLAVATERPIIGLFDNDRKGNEQYNGLNKRAFNAHDETTGRRDHLTKSVSAVLLTVPSNRGDFVSQKMEFRLLEIEHFFDDELLEQQGLKGDPIFPGVGVFEIRESRKAAFSEIVDTLPADSFSEFSLVFDQLKDANSKFGASE